MILGRTDDNKIKIKTDSPKGLRAVECACCCSQIPAGTNVTITALGKSQNFTMQLLPDGITTIGDAGETNSDRINVQYCTRYVMGEDCASDYVNLGCVPDWVDTYSWRFSIIGCNCYFYLITASNISDYYQEFRFGICDCPMVISDTIWNTIGSPGFNFPINGKGTYQVLMPDITQTSRCPKVPDIINTKSVTVIIS